MGRVFQLKKNTSAKQGQDVLIIFGLNYIFATLSYNFSKIVQGLNFHYSMLFKVSAKYFIIGSGPIVTLKSTVVWSYGNTQLGSKVGSHKSVTLILDQRLSLPSPLSKCPFWKRLWHQELYWSVQCILSCYSRKINGAEHSWFICWGDHKKK